MKTAEAKRVTRAGVPLALLGARVRRARKAAGLSQDKLAALAGCSRIHVWRIEQGQHEPADTLLSRIAETTDQPLTFFTKKPAKRQTSVGEFAIPPEARDAFVEAASSLLVALMQAVAQAKAASDREEVEV